MRQLKNIRKTNHLELLVSVEARTVAGGQLKCFSIDEGKVRGHVIDITGNMQRKRGEEQDSLINVGLSDAKRSEQRSYSIR